MTAARLYELLTYLVETDTKLGIQQTLESLAGAFDDLVSAPSAVPNQTALSTAMHELETRFQFFQQEVTPVQLEAFNEIKGATKYFDVSLPENIRREMAANPLSPSVVSKHVRTITTERKAFIDNLQSTRKGLEILGVRPEPLSKGHAEMAFVIPRRIFDGQLGSLAKELGFINRLLRDVSEAATGHPEQIEVTQLSSSDPTFT